MKLRINKNNELTKMTCVKKEDTILDIPEGVVTLKACFPTFLSACDCYNSIDIKEIIIPSTLKTIEDSSLIGFENIEKININPNNENFKVVDGCLYSIDGKKLYLVPKKQKELVIPEGVEEICRFACEWGEYETIVFPKTLKKISFGAFKLCQKIKELHFPDGLEIIEGRAFMTNDKLFKISYSKNTQVDKYAFDYCQILTIKEVRK